MALIAGILEYKVSTTRELFDAESGWRDASGDTECKLDSFKFLPRADDPGSPGFQLFQNWDFWSLTIPANGVTMVDHFLR